MARPRMSIGDLMPGYTSTVPGAILGLLSAFRASPALEGVEILDGPTVSESKSPEAIVVGFTGERMSRTGAYPEPASPDVDVTATLDGLSTLPTAEDYPIRCLLAVRNGAKNVTAARTRAYQLLSAVGGVIAADKRLGGAVALASLGNHTLTQDTGPKGADATIVLDVNCQAWT